MPLHCFVVFTSVAITITVCSGVRFVVSCHISVTSRHQRQAAAAVQLDGAIFA